MKVLIVGPAFPLRGGIADFNEALCTALLAQGDAASIVSFSYQYPSFLFPGKSQKATGGSPTHLKIKSLISSVNPISWFTTARYIRKEKPDYIIIRYWLPFMAPALGTIARLVKRKSNIRIIAITDNVIPHEKRLGDKMLSNYFISACDAFVTLSSAVLNHLSLFTNNQHKIFIPHPVYNIFGEKISKQEARKNLSLNIKDNIILFFGFIRAYKGLDLLLEAMGDERLRQLQVKLIIAGEFYEDEKKYRDIITKNKIAKNIILHTSFIAKEKVSNYFCAADMVVQPYRSATQSGITQIAYHFERPMLVTDVGGLPEIVAHHQAGYVVQRNARDIADAILHFYQEKKEEEFSRFVASEKHKFSWSAFVNGIRGLYQQIV